MNPLVGGASTQSRANRPLPEGWDPVVVARSGVTEEWWFLESPGINSIHRIDVTWVFDQGGPVLGYTGGRNPWTRRLQGVLRRVIEKGMYGPGAVVSYYERLAAEFLVGTVGQWLRHDQDLRVRFLANGSDACDCAVRLARAYTGRTHFVSIGYHGSSGLFAHKPQNAGVPYGVTFGRYDVTFGDSQALAVALETGPPHACVIVEVPSGDGDARSFLQYARRLCDETGALLVLDEVVTGFRICLGGAAEYYGVEPDIACYGKAMANGRGISAVVGRAGVMDLLTDRVFYSNTYNGDPYNCAHVLGTLLTLRERNEKVYPHLWTVGELLQDGLNEVLPDTYRCVGHPPRTAVVPRDDWWLGVCRELVRRGVVMDRPNYASMAHGANEVERTLEALVEVLYE